jgi:hypothetical protein
MQLALVLKVLVGAEETQQMMIEAIEVAKQARQIRPAAPLTTDRLRRP